MKILLLYPQSPYPPIGGASIRRWQVFRFLAQRHQVTLVYFGNPDTDPAPDALQALAAMVSIVRYPAALSVQDLDLGKNVPVPVKHFTIAAMAKTIEALAPQSFDLVLVETLYMGAYRDLLPAQTVLFEQNIESQLYKQYADSQQEVTPVLQNADWRVMAFYENRIWNTFSLRVAVSSADKQEMDRRCSRGCTVVVENGVDLETHPLLPPLKTRTLVFMGMFDYFPNLDAAYFLIREILPHIWRMDAGAQLLLAGSHPPPELFAACADPRVHLIANPMYMEHVARRASVAVVPLRFGGGTRLKILEAFAWGLPVVTTFLGCSGLEVEDGIDLLVCDEPEAIAQAVIRLWSRPSLYETLREQARHRVERSFDWQPILERMETKLVEFAHHAGIN